jgi:hypothetical protein
VAGLPVYERIFAPACGAGPSGLADRPRPFVFRAKHLDGRTVHRGERFDFDVNLFDTRDRDSAAWLAAAFSQLARDGMGSGRGTAELIETSGANSAVRLSLEPVPEPVSRATVRFVTPTELKGCERPEFAVLAARIRDRLSTLRALYGDGPLPIDFRAFGERAARVAMTRCLIAPVKSSRRSGRTGQVHPLGGFIGEAAYEGDLAGFIPYLLTAQWTGVGRQTVWGKGEIEVLWSTTGA